MPGHGCRSHSGTVVFVGVGCSNSNQLLTRRWHAFPFVWMWGGEGVGNLRLDQDLESVPGAELAIRDGEGPFMCAVVSENIGFPMHNLTGSCLTWDGVADTRG